jgi:hypothetical protein
MKWFGLLLLCCILCCCGQPSVTHNVVDTVNTSVAALEQSLGKDCKGKGIELQIDNIKKQISLFEGACATDVGIMRAAKVNWQTAFFGLLLMVLSWMFIKTKKVI